MDIGNNLYTTALELYRQLFAALWGEFQVNPANFVHYEQLVRAAGSISANIAEGTGRNVNGKKYYQNFLLIARGSLFETVAWLDLANFYVGDSELIQKIQKRYMSLGDKLEEEIQKENTK